MQVDNSGTIVVHDAKSQEAIDAFKNKVTLLQAEELRYKKLIAELKSEVITLEGSIAYLKEMEIKQKERNDEQEAKLVTTEAYLADAEEKTQALLTTLDSFNTQKADAEAALTEREIAVSEREGELSELAESLTRNAQVLAEKQEAYEEKKAKLEQALK